MTKKSRVQYGGATNKVPKPSDLGMRSLADFKQKMTFYNILGHGTIASASEGDGSVFLVPPRTYIFFVTRAGIPAAKQKEGTLKRELENLFFKDADNSPSENAWWERIHSAMESQTLLRDVLYTPETAGAEGIQSKFALYEPGDLVQNLTIQFFNDVFPYMMLGVWKLPIQQSTKRYLDDINGVFDTFPESTRPMRESIQAQAEELMKTKPEDKRVVNDIIIPFLNKINKMTMAEEAAFIDNPDVKRIRNAYPAINRLIQEVYSVYQSISKFGDKEAYFRRAYGNLQESFRSIQRSGGFSTLYKLIHEDFRGEFPINMSASHILSTIDDSGQELYRFIVVDACRSLQQEQPFEARLRRSLSGYSRPEVCVSSLLRLTAEKFASLPGMEHSLIFQRLLRGEEIKTSDFEVALTGIAMKNNRPSYATSEFLEHHIFDRGDTAYIITKLGPIQGIIEGIKMSETGLIQYLFNVRGLRQYVNATDLWKHPDAMNLAELTFKQNVKQIQQQVENEKRRKAETDAAAAAETARLLEEKKRSNEAFAARQAANKAAKESAEAAQIKTFEDEVLKAKIAALPEEQRILLKYNKRVLLSLPAPPPNAAEGAKAVYSKYNNVLAYVKYVELKGDKISVFVEPIRIGANAPVLPGRTFGPQFLKPAPAAPKKGGKSRRSKKSKRRQTRRR